MLDPGVRPFSRIPTHILHKLSGEQKSTSKPSTVFVSITEEDIERGIPGSLTDSPLNLALYRTFGDAFAVTENYIYDKRFRHRITITQRLKVFLYKFDKGEKVFPMEFPLLMCAALK